MKNLQKWQILSSKMVIDELMCPVRQHQRELLNGKIINDYFVNIKPDIAIIFPITENQDLVFVRQYR